jgi:hypothetical protein
MFRSNFDMSIEKSTQIQIMYFFGNTENFGLNYLFNKYFYIQYKKTNRLIYKKLMFWYNFKPES